MDILMLSIQWIIANAEMEILNLRVRYKPQEVGVFSGK